MNFSTYFLCIFLSYFVCTKCQSAEDDFASEEDTLFPGPSEKDSSQPNKVESPYQTSDFAHFDLSFLNTLCTKHQNQNVVVSPASMKSLLALLLKVYSRDKLVGIMNTMGKDSPSVAYLWKLRTLLQNNETAMTVESRNKIYLASGVDINDMATESAELETLDFSNPTAADTINKWVNESTRGLIRSVVDRGQISELTKLVILNTIYLKAKWDVSFNPMRTSEDCFNTATGKCRSVKFMQMKRMLKYVHLKERSAVLIELPFVDKRYAIVFVMPHGNNITVYDVLTGLLNEDLFKLFGKMSEENVELHLPRTSIEFSDGDLINILKKKNVRSFFGRNAKLDTLLQYDVFSEVNTLFHRARIVLNEEGAEAAAVSGAMEFRSIFQDTTVKLDRPFLFFLRDAQTGLILFEGLVNLPDSAN